MKTRLFFPHGLACLAAVTLLSASAQAGVITLTKAAVTFNTSVSFIVAIPKFDSTLGTLTSVTLNWSETTLITSAFVKNLSPNSVKIDRIDFTNTFDTGVPGKTILSGGSTSYDPVVTLANLQQKNETNVSLDPATKLYSFTSSLSNYESVGGVGFHNLTVSDSLGGASHVTDNGGNNPIVWETSVAGYSSGSVVASYTYELTAVPEPSNIMLCGAPVLLAGAAFVRRSRKNRKNLP